MAATVSVSLLLVTVCRYIISVNDDHVVPVIYPISVTQCIRTLPQAGPAGVGEISYQRQAVWTTKRN